MQGLWRIAEILVGRTGPHPRSCRPRQKGNNYVKFLVGVDVDDPDLRVRQEPPGRKDVQAAQLRFDLGERLIAHSGSLGGDDHKRTIDRQPKGAGDLLQTALVEPASLK